MKKKTYKLSALAEFNTGVLQTRIEDPITEVPSDRIIFNPLAETPKYVHGTSELPTIQNGTAAISMLQKHAFIAKPQPNTAEQVLTANYTALSFDDRIRPDFFVWWFNCSIEAQSQLQERGQLGRRIVVRDLHELTITIPDLAVQEDIAKLYQNGVEAADIYRKLADTIEEKSQQFIQQHIAKELAHEE